MASGTVGFNFLRVAGRMGLGLGRSFFLDKLRGEVIKRGVVADPSGEWGRRSEPPKVFLDKLRRGGL